MTIQEAMDFVKKITYKPNSKIVLEENDMTGMLQLIVEVNVLDSVYQQKSINLTNTKSLHEKELAKWDEGDLKSAILDVALELETHEMHEWLKLDGKHIIKPHDWIYEA